MARNVQRYGSTQVNAVCRVGSVSRPRQDNGCHSEKVPSTQEEEALVVGGSTEGECRWREGEVPARLLFCTVGTPECGSNEGANAPAQVVRRDGAAGEHTVPFKQCASEETAQQCAGFKCWQASNA